MYYIKSSLVRLPNQVVFLQIYISCPLLPPVCLAAGVLPHASSQAMMMCGDGADADDASMSKVEKSKRKKNDSKESAEAEEHAKELGLNVNSGNTGDEDALRMMIAKRQEKRAQESNNFLDALAAKYAKPEKKSKDGGKKRK